MINNTIDSREGTSLRCTRKTRKGGALIATVFVTLFVSSLGLSLSSLVSNSSAGAVDDLQSQQAAYVVEGGLHYILMKEFINSSDFTAASTASNVALGAGVFSVTYANLSATAADITVIGQVQNSISQIQQHVVKQYGTGSAISGTDVTLTSSQSGGGSIDGPATYTQSFTGDGGYALNPAAAPGTAPPAVGLTALLAMTSSTINGDYTVPNGFSGYVRVTGNVTISGDITMSGLIVADGNISLSANKDDITLNGTLAAGGNITTDFKNGSIVTMTAQTLGGQMQPLMIAVGNIVFSQQQNTATTLRGLIRAGGNVTMDLKQSDTLSIQGAIVANGNVAIDSKQSSNIGVSFNSGSAYLPGSLLLTNWKKV